MTQIDKDPSAWIHPATQFAGRAVIGFCSRVGHGDAGIAPVRIGADVSIGAFCLIEGGTQIAEDVEIDHYCRIGRDVQIGPGTRVLYGARIFDDVTIGANCIIAGDLVDRSVVERNVTFQGETAHGYADPTGSWDDTVEPSPTIKAGSIVGVRATVIGGVTIGPRAYIAAGERVTCDVPENTVLRNGTLAPLSAFRGLIKVRDL